MNLQDQIGALEAGVDQLIQVAAAAHTAPTACIADAASAEQAVVTPATSVAPAAQYVALPPSADSAADAAAADVSTPVETPAPEASASAEAIAVAEAQATVDAEPAADAQPADPPTLQVSRPSQNEITMTIGGQTVALHPQQIGQLIEELANARASMTPEPPPGIPPGWRFASTKNPVMAVQKQSNGDRLLVLRHTGHGWVPFTFSPDMVIQMYMMLTQR